MAIAASPDTAYQFAITGDDDVNVIAAGKERERLACLPIVRLPMPDQFLLSLTCYEITT